MPRFPAPGETLMGSNFTKGFGGKGANQCIMAARLVGNNGVASESDLRVAMVAAVGDDSFGTEYTSSFEAEGVATDTVKVVPGIPTGVAPIWVNEEGENCIVVVPGANEHLLAADVEKSRRLLEASCVCLCQLEIPQETTLAALQCVRATGRGVNIFTPAPAPPKPLPDAFYSLTDILVPNQVEALVLAGMEPCEHPTLTQLAAAADALLLRGCGSVVITLGGRGSLIAHSALPRCVHVPAVPVARVVDTTGAGDAFSGALAFFYAQLTRRPIDSSRPAVATLVEGSGSASTASSSGSRTRVDASILIEAVRRAAFVAADSVTKKGTQSSYARRSELPAELFSSEDWSQLPVPAPLDTPAETQQGNAEAH